jgi:hypothetical protein
LAAFRSELPSLVGEHRWQPTCLRPADLVRPVPIDPTGLRGPTRGAANGPRYRRTSPGLYVPVEVDEAVVEQRILEQGCRIVTHGAVTGWAALRWRGAAFFDGEDRSGDRLPVPLVVGDFRLRSDPRVEISRAQIASRERSEVGGLWCTTVQRALFDAMRSASGVRAAVVVMDMTAAARLISVQLMSRYVACRRAWTGVEIVRTALALASNDSRSPQETRMRLVWVLDAGLPTPLCNVPVFDLSGQLLGIPDLFDPVAGLVGEYNGADHKELDRRRLDNAREARFRNVGLEYFDLVEGDLGDRPAVVRRMEQTRRRALFAAPEARLWTLTPPAWWRPREEPLDVHLVRTGQAGFLVRA